MTSKRTKEFDRSDLEKILYSGNYEVRLCFQKEFPSLINSFLDEAEQSYERYRKFSNAVTRDIRAAWVEAFIFYAFNSALTSCHLLISGFQISAGNLMRQYAEATAMALLCSHHAINVVKRLNNDPDRFPVHKALQIVQQGRNVNLLKVKKDGWNQFKAIAEWHNDYSHASILSVATQRLLNGPSSPILGVEFDEAKRSEYKKDLTLRISSMKRFRDLIDVVEQHVITAQAKGLITV